VIEVVGLGRTLGKKRVLDGLTFTASTDEVTAFLGPNGAGKTTTIRVLATLLRPDEGSVMINGFDVVEQAHEVRRNIGVVTEEAGVLDRLTPREQVTMWGRAHGLSAEHVEERVEQLCQLLSFGEYIDIRCGKLSKGNRQKAAVARALVHEPPVILLDEPTANLDVLATNAILELLKTREIRTGRTVLLATHRLEEAEHYADRVVGIADGRTVVTGTPAEIAEQAGTTSFIEGFVRLLGEIAMQRVEEEEAAS
jgi:sodium transport system ATP-binding protein